MTSNQGSVEHARLKETLAPSPDCATLEELAELADPSVASPSRTRVAVHVAACKRCEAELALLKEFESAAPRAEEKATVDWIVTRLRRRFREARVVPLEAAPDVKDEEETFWQRLFHLRPASALGFGFATAMVLLAVGVEVRESREPPLHAQVESSTEVYRSTAVQLRGPVGDLDSRPARLEWEPVAAASSYSVQVLEVDRSEVWKAEAAGTSIALPEAVTDRLVPGKPLLWRVEAKDSSGRILATSQLQRFRMQTHAAAPATPAPAAAPGIPAPPTAPVFNPRQATNSRLTAAASGVGAATPLSFKILSRTAPPDGTAQLTVTLTEPKPIATGFAEVAGGGGAFDAVFGAALFTAAGAPSDVAGTAVVDGTSVTIHAASPSEQFGTDPLGAPIAVVTYHVSPSALPGEAGKMTMDPRSLWFDFAGGLYPLEIKPGSFEVAGSISIDNVIPGSGFLPAGSTVTVLGTGFVEGTTVEIDDVPSTSTFVGPGRIDLVIATGAEFHGRRLRATNPDRSRASYYSYMRAARVGESSRPLLARTMPIFPSAAASASFVAVAPAAPGGFFGIAVQNPNPGPALVTIDLRFGGGEIASTTLSLPSRSKISREVSELFGGAAAPPGGFLAVHSDLPVQVLGLAGNDSTGAVLPVIPSLALP